MFKKYLRLMRAEQWYKNLIILIPIFLMSAQSRSNVLEIVCIFFGLSAVSSMTYIINDWIDRDRDKLHPIKKNRPLASGEVSGKEAIIANIFLAIFVVTTAYFINGLFAWEVGIYFVLTNMYSLGLKNVPILDMVIIIFNFLLRMSAVMPVLPTMQQFWEVAIASGTILIFLTHKRRSEIKSLGAHPEKHKEVLKYYTRPVLYFLRVGGYLAVMLAGIALDLDRNGQIIMISWLIILGLVSFKCSRDEQLAIKPHILIKNYILPTILIGLIAYFLYSMQASPKL